MGNVCVAMSESSLHRKRAWSDNEDTSSSSTQSSRSSNGGFSFTRRLINLSNKRRGSSKKAMYPVQAGPRDSPVWQRAILMGERCEPPVFSGLILYDEYGNSVPGFPCRSPKSPLHPALGLTAVV